MDTTERVRRATIALCASLLVLLGSVTPAVAAITSRGPAATTAYTSDTATSVTLGLPSGAQPGDVLIATIGFGNEKNSAAVTAPAGWTLVTRVNEKTRTSIAIYRHVLAAGESAFSWRFSVPVGGVSAITAFAGADPADPVDVSGGINIDQKGKSFSTPSLTTTTPGTMLVASYLGLRGKGKISTWSSASGMTELADRGESQGRRSGGVYVATQATAGSTGKKTATANQDQEDAVAVLTALKPAASGTPNPPPPAPSGATPVILDSDIWSSADDVGAMAIAYAMALRGEAKVLAVGISRKPNQPVEPNSWKCAASIARFYGFGSVPIGTTLPANGTETSPTNFAAPCAALGDPNAPAPQDVVALYRKTLAGQADGSVVMTSFGFLNNLAKLLDSPADAYSSLTGAQLVAKKVRLLVSMGGGYPSFRSETNLSGDLAASQKVAQSWPTKLVWAGYEVGDAVYTGQTISSVHPSSSPVRAAYEKYSNGPNNYIESYDLTAVYHALRPNDTKIGEAGPGRNAITSTGNVFTTGSGTQWYETLPSAAPLASAIETLLDTLPSGTGSPPPSSAGPSDTFDANVIDPAKWSVTSSGSTVSAASGELLITHPAGSWTKGLVESAAPYDQTGKAVQVQVKRPANGGSGGSTFGETSIDIRADNSHYAEFFFAGGSLTPWVNKGSGETRLTSGWPAYSPTAMQFVRFREAGGTLFYEYAASASGPWSVLASTPNPFPLTSVKLRISAGANTSTSDVARFDNVSTTG